MTRRPIIKNATQNGRHFSSGRSISTGGRSEPPVPKSGNKPAIISFAAITAEKDVIYAAAVAIIAQIVFAGLVTITKTGFMAAAAAIAAAAAATTAFFVKITAHATLRPPVCPVLHHMRRTSGKLHNMSVFAQPTLYGQNYAMNLTVVGQFDIRTVF